MARKTKRKDKAAPAEEALWIAPRFSLKGANGERAWDNRPGGPPNSSRLLELADIALGTRKPEPRKKLHSGNPHERAKTEPYSGQNKK